MIFVYGKGVTVTGLNGASQTLTRPGFEVTVSGPGASPSDPGPAPPGATAAMLAQLDGRAGGNGGAPVVPTEVTVTNSGIANVISANVPASIQAAAKTQPTRRSSRRERYPTGDAGSAQQPKCLGLRRGGHPCRRGLYRGP